MDIYRSYLDNIKQAISNEAKLKNTHFATDDFITKGLIKDQTRLLSESKQANPLPSLQRLSNEWGLQPVTNQKLGAHPDFAYLKHSDSFEEHYIHSMFIDIKKSTNLFKRYPPLTVGIINNTVQRAAIHTCMILGGYIHRLLGDGTFVYFGGRQQAPLDSIQRCMKAASLFSHFMKNDIRQLFEENNIEPIYTRIGIDYGTEKDVIWLLAGVGEASEVTTCSLHTSLAPKMQAHAVSNGIVVGDNVVKLYPTDYYSPVCHRTGLEEDRYIFKNPEKGFNYTQHDFDWLKFLKSQNNITTNYLTGDLNIKPKQVPAQLSTSGLIGIASSNKPYYES